MEQNGKLAQKPTVPTITLKLKLEGSNLSVDKLEQSNIPVKTEAEAWDATVQMLLAGVKMAYGETKRCHETDAPVIEVARQMPQGLN